MPDPSALLARDPTLASLVEEAKARLDDDPGHDLHHALRVAKSSLALADGAVDPRLVVAAALLHDAVNVPKDSPERARASELSAALARELLPRHGFSPDEVELVADAIVDHSYSRGAVPRSLLGKVLQDADRLEALGALGLMRCVCAGARMNSRFFDALDPWAERRALDDRRYSVDHFFVKLLDLPATMQTAGGRREAERRAEFLRVFLTQLASELDQPLTREPRR